MEVTDVLRDRMHEPGGLDRMAAVSLLVHVVVFAALVFVPRGWLTRSSQEPAAVMTITLAGGGDGPQNGGLTAIGGRAIQAPTPPDAPREALRAPAAVAPEMTVPEPAARPQRAASKAVEQAPPEARGRTPSRGAQVENGTSVAVTGARGEGFGLSSGGGPGMGSSLDVADFCCPGYLVTMISRVRANWRERQNVSGVAKIKFVILRDGTLQDIMLEESSGFPVADLAAQRAVILTRQLPPLPDAFPDATLGVHLIFEYQR